MPIWIFRFLGKHWKTIAIIVGVGLGYLYFQREADGWAKKYEAVEKSHAAEIQQIEKARDVEKAQLQANVTQLQNEMATVKQQYDEQIKLLATKKKAVVKQIIEQSGHDPKQLAQQLSDVTGFRVQPVVTTP